MTIAYSINGGAEIHGVQSSWKRVPKRTNSDGTIDFSKWAINTWQIATIGLTNFETLRAQQGQLLTTIETNNINNINENHIYTSAFIEGVVNGGQLGIQMHRVTVTFRIDTTAPVWRVVGVPWTHPSRDYRRRHLESADSWRPSSHPRRVITSQ